ncbi:MAG: hypothetical protein AAFP77_31445, partial [Bacteroidota bacterium]
GKCENSQAIDFALFYWLRSKSPRTIVIIQISEISPKQSVISFVTIFTIHYSDEIQLTLIITTNFALLH